MGGLFTIKAKHPDIKVYASELDAPSVNGSRQSLRLAQARAIFDHLPEKYKAGAKQFEQMLLSMKPVTVDVTFGEDAKPTNLKNINIINTPGHMPGHISLYLPETKTVIDADALVFENDELNMLILNSPWICLPPYNQ